MIDHRERVLLCRIHGDSTWRPVSARVIRVWPTRHSLIRVLDTLFSHWFLAATPVIGRFNPVAEQAGRADSMRIFVVRHRKMRPISLRVRTHSFPDADYAWHRLTDVEDGELDVCPRELDPLLRGYLEGWIPDGVITLVE
ncbi:hypothetical protein [Streptomyces cavernae]|uniref:hypothetical protein n=1 Tax=Streptomyces cavernae TaxID=2259034 RepID=UPI000FEC146F|nr:hypothetical protein [Streptomyces cavernae]